MPAGSYIEEFPEPDHFHRGRDAPDLRNMAAYIIERAVRHRLDELIQVIEQFAHRERHGSVRPELLEQAHILRAYRIFDPERVEFFQLLAHIDHILWLNAFMRIMQELYFFSADLPHGPEQFRYRLHVCAGIDELIGRLAKARILKIGLLRQVQRAVATLLDPHIEFFRFIPPVAFVTLAVVWFGIGESSKVVLIFYTSVFIVTLNTVAGVLAVSESKLRAAVSLGAGRRQIMLYVVLPATVPHVVTGARLAMGNSFLTIVSAEIVAAQVGLGALIWTSRNYGRIDWVFVGIIVLGVLGFVFDRVLRIVARRVLRRYAVKL